MVSIKERGFRHSGLGGRRGCGISMNHKQCNLRYIKISFFCSLRLCVKKAETEGFFVIVSRLALVQYIRILSKWIV